jgi:hypothetical protein
MIAPFKPVLSVAIALTVQNSSFAATFLPCSPSSFGCEKDTVFHPRLLIVLGLWVGLYACQPTNLAAFIPSTQPTKSSTFEQVTLTGIVFLPSPKLLPHILRGAASKLFKKFA